MKKTILTLSLLAVFSITVNAQDSKTTSTKKQDKKEKTVKEDGTAGAKPTATVSEKKEDAPVKKGGTRMAINEKGTSGSIQPKNKTEEKKSDGPAVQPGSGSKKD